MLQGTKAVHTSRRSKLRSPFARPATRLLATALRASVELYGGRHIDLTPEDRLRIGEYVAHYHGERNHQGIGKERIAQLKRRRNDTGKVARRERLGGLLNHKEREAG